jgi:hypothetical protein
MCGDEKRRAEQRSEYNRTGYAEHSATGYNINSNMKY